MAAAISLLVAVTLSILVTRVATVALTLTGLSREVARFQARSAFSGVGFTTSEAESVMKHPVRRRIVLLLILLGSAGVVSVIATLILSFVGSSGPADAAGRGALLLGGVVVLIVIARSQLVDRWLSRTIERALKRFTRLDVRDYASLLRLSGNWSVAELEVREGDWLANRTLEEVDLPHEGVLVLGIERADGRWVGAPKGTAPLYPGDTVLVYGMERTVAELDERDKGQRGERLRRKARRRYEEHMTEQQKHEPDG
ncbi:MAG TPA: TrkA C-terminal domain-containing protein [Actinomycetota bacterium]|nr:TrkA C-terminal domain-containing protein [Actinomycetota bacterium]